MTVMLAAAIPGRPPFADRPEKACNDEDPELWWPIERTNNSRRGAEAKEICRRCVFQRECLAWALDHDDRWGIWGGHDERQRRHIREQGRCRDTDCNLCAVPR